MIARPRCFRLLLPGFLSTARCLLSASPNPQLTKTNMRCRRGRRGRSRQGARAGDGVRSLRSRPVLQARRQHELQEESSGTGAGRVRRLLKDPSRCVYIPYVISAVHPAVNQVRRRAAVPRRREFGDHGAAGERCVRLGRRWTQLRNKTLDRGSGEGGGCDELGRVAPGT